MAHADVNIGLTIDEWAAIMGIDLYEINQVGNGFPTGSTNTQFAACEHTFYQYAWQFDFLGRQEVGEAIQKAEEALYEYLNYWPYPRYILNEEVKFTQPHERYLYGAGTDKRWKAKAIQLQSAKIQAAGTLVATDLGSQAVTYSDANHDTVLDTFTVSFPTTITDPTQLALYFTPADRDNAPFDQQWRIRPCNVSINAGTATITGHRGLCVKPERQNGYNAAIIDVTDATAFVSNLEVYSLILDQSTTQADPAQGQAEWEGYMENGLFVDCGIPPCNVEVWPICVGLRKAESGIVTFDYLLNGQNSPVLGHEPDRVVVNYVAGTPRMPDGRMDRTMADMVAHLATAWLAVDKCGCERSSRIIHWWRSFPQDGMDTRSISPKEVDNNPFGPTMGALYTWHRAKYLDKMMPVST